MMSQNINGTFVFEPSEGQAQKTVLYEKHIALTDKSHIAPFAGFLMPLWYSSISSEHKAVREAAGLFDCTHMGVLEVQGFEVADFLNLIATNDVSKITDGSAQYSYILDAAGNVLDDIIIYRRTSDKFMVVVNAANEPKIKAYIDALLEGQAILDVSNPKRKLEYEPSIRDMKDTSAGSDCKADIALQGPASLDIILALLKDNAVKEKIKALKPFKFIETTICENVGCIISRTGYTGAKVSFELYAHPSQAPLLWDKLLEYGKSFGLVPCGLGARDSLRIEAGLPLYGHELNGPFNISPFAAGYGWAVKLDKKFFIGKDAMQKEAAEYNAEVVRLKLPGEKGVRPVRQNDGVLVGGKCIGWVLSCAAAGEKQIALALVEKNIIKENTPVGIYYLARSQGQIQKGKKEKVRKGQELQQDIEGIAAARFEKF